MSNQVKKFVESNVPSHLSVNIHHMHCGNSSRRSRHGHEYVTICKLVDSGSNVIVAEGKACCSKQDTPNRGRGRDIAIGRALRNYTWKTDGSYALQRQVNNAQLDAFPELVAMGHSLHRLSQQQHVPVSSEVTVSIEAALASDIGAGSTETL